MVHAQSQSEIEARLSVIEAAMSRIHSLGYSFHLTQHTLRNPDDLESIDTTEPIYTKGHVFFEPLNGRYRIGFEEVNRWVGGAAPFIARIQRSSFDGEVYRSWHCTRHGQTLPGEGDHPGHGLVRRKPEDFLGAFALASGLAFLPPYFCSLREVRPLVEILRSRSGERLSIVPSASDPDEWLIEFYDYAYLCGASERDSEPVAVDARLRFSLSKGGVVEAAFGNGDPSQTFRRIIADSYHGASQGIALPGRVSVISCFRPPFQTDRVVYSDVQINAQPDEHTFDVVFPTGTRVDDEITQQSYVVGGSSRTEFDR